MIYAYVYDVEPCTPEKHYEMERDIYHHSSHFDGNEFPSFEQWMGEQAATEERRNAWIRSVLDEAGYQCAETFDPWYDRASNLSAAAPENGTKGERD